MGRGGVAAATGISTPSQRAATIMHDRKAPPTLEIYAPKFYAHQMLLSVRSRKDKKKSVNLVCRLGLFGNREGAGCTARPAAHHSVTSMFAIIIAC